MAWAFVFGSKPPTLTTQERNSSQRQSHASELTLGWALPQQDPGQQDRSCRIEGTDHRGNVEPSQLRSHHVEQVSDRIERSGDDAGYPETSPRSFGGRNGNDENDRDYPGDPAGGQAP